MLEEVQLLDEVKHSNFLREGQTSASKAKFDISFFSRGLAFLGSQRPALAGYVLKRPPN